MTYQCDEFDYEEGQQCPRCDGWQSVECYCGGDLCVCENYGEADCPLCFGEGSVSDELYEKYQQKQAENAKIWANIVANAEKGTSE